MSLREREIRLRLKTDFEYYASRCLKIRTKSGKIEPFQLNKAQQHIHEKLEEQRRKTGKVRALVLKGRQQGVSTYIEGRYYQKTTHRKGVRTFILTHEQEATNNLFEMANRYHEYCPPLVKPHTAASNAKELMFDRLDSGYKVGTAGNKGTGRSSTIQYFHGSEVAYWPNADEHAAGVLQAVPDQPDTEVILESTANGIGNLYHRMWQDAEAGMSEYIAVFVPWFWQDEYRKPVPEGFRLTPEESDYQTAYSLDTAQMVWRRAKIAELNGDENLFRKEYPATPAEAFQTSGDNSYIAPQTVLKARKAKANEYGSLVVGVDPARFGEDRTAIIRRKGRRAYGGEAHTKKDTMEVAGIVVRIINEEKPAKVFIDVVGLGAGVYDRLREMGYGDRIMGVNSGEKPMNGEKYTNKRAEMWGLMREWLEDQPAQIPDDDELHADLTGPQYSYDSNNRLRLEKKEDMKKRGLRSPDKGDALALTFAFPVSETAGKPLKINTRWIV